MGKEAAPPTTCLYVGGLCPRHWSSPSPHSPENPRPPSPARCCWERNPKRQQHPGPLEASVHSGHSHARASGPSRPTRGQLPTWKPPSPAKPKPHLSLGVLRIPTEWKGRASGAPGAKPPALSYPTLFTHTLREGGPPTGNRHPPCQHAQQQGTLDRTCSNPKATLPHPSTHPHRAGGGRALSLAVSQGPSPHSLATPSQTVLPQQSPPAPGLPSWTALGSGVGTVFPSSPSVLGAHSQPAPHPHLLFWLCHSQLTPGSGAWSPPPAQVPNP